MNKSIVIRSLLATAAVTVAGSTFAATSIDVTPIVDTINGVLVPVTSIGIAVLTVVVGIKVFKWAKAAL